MISLINITKKYGENEILKNFSISFNTGDITCLTGPSGVGKTTVANILAGLLKPDAGSVIGTDGLKFSYVFQEPRLLEWYDVYSNLDFVLKDIYKPDNRKAIIKRYLEMMELTDCTHMMPSELSGGMAQRISIARAFAYPCDVLIMDEPFKGLDIKLKDEIMLCFEKLWQVSRRTVIFITHDVSEAVRLSHTLYILKGMPTEVVTSLNKSDNISIYEVEKFLRI